MVVVKRPVSPDYGTEVDVGEEVDIPTNNARQAVSNQNVRYVLAVGLGGAIVALIIAYLVFLPG